MKTESQIMDRLTEINGEIRRLDNKETLNLSMSAEEYEVLDGLCSERDALNWVIGP